MPLANPISGPILLFPTSANQGEGVQIGASEPYLQNAVPRHVPWQLFHLFAPYAQKLASHFPLASPLASLEAMQHDWQIQETG